MNYLMASDTARAFEWFEKAYEVRDTTTPPTQTRSRPPAPEGVK
jgi:hypothetical protein